jgi:DNA-binding NarL/FixJ family response regulator
VRGEPIRILVVEDHTIVRQALVSMIEGEEDMCVAGEASNGREAVEAFLRLRPTVTLLDLRLPVLDGFQALREIRLHEPSARVVVLTTFEGDEDIHRALEAGALSYLVKDVSRDEMLGAVRGAADGRRWIPPGVASRLAESLPRVELTARELDVLRLVARGARNREIALALAIAENTVKVHMSRILTALGAKDRTEAVAIARRRGVLHDDELR